MEITHRQKMIHGQTAWMAERQTATVRVCVGVYVMGGMSKSMGGVRDTDQEKVKLYNDKLLRV